MDILRFAFCLLLAVACVADDFDGPPLRNSSGSLRSSISANYDDDADDSHCKLAHHLDLIIPAFNALVGPGSIQLLSNDAPISSLPTRFGLSANAGRAPPRLL